MTFGGSSIRRTAWGSACCWTWSTTILATTSASVQRFAGAYFSRTYQNEWGSAVNFDGPASGPVREFYLANVRYWIEEFHLDGYRIDATQAIHDSSPEHILAAIGRAAREAAGRRGVAIIGESEPQNAQMVRPVDAGGFGMEALWNDDFHHSAMVRLTGHNEAYYSDYLGLATEFVALLKWGFLYQGQFYSWQNGPRGTAAFDLPAAAFIHYLQNHDQIANSRAGERIHQLTSPGRLRAMAALWLLAPQTPLLFQGQEFAASAPFQFFLDSPAEHAAAVAGGRGRFLAQFPSLATAEVQQRLPDPADPATFRRCKLDLTERKAHAPVYALHRDLLRLRRSDGIDRGGAARSNRCRHVVGRCARGPLVWRRWRRSLAGREFRPRFDPRADARAPAGTTGWSQLADALVERGSALRRRGQRLAGGRASLAIAGRGALLLAGTLETQLPRKE